MPSRKILFELRSFIAAALLCAATCFPAFLPAQQTFHRSDSLFALAKQSGLSDTALTYAQEAVAAAGADSLHPHFAPLYSLLGTINARRGNYAAALLNFEKAKLIGKLSNDELLVAKTDINIANILLSEGNYDSSVRLYLEALSTEEKTGDSAVLSLNYLMIAQAYYFLKDYRQSGIYYEKAKAIFEAQHDERQAAYCYNSLGVISKETGDYDSSLQWLTRTRQIAEKYNDSLLLASSLTSLGELYGLTGKYREGLTCLQNGIAIQQVERDKKAVAESGVLIGRIYTKMNLYDSAIAFFNKSLSLAYEVGVNEVKKDAYKGLADVYEAEGKHQEALNFLSLYAAMKDTLYNENRTRQIADMQTKYDSEKKEAENALLLKQNQLTTLEVEKQRNQRNFLILSLVLVVVVGGLIYNRIRLRQRNKLLEERELRSQAVFRAHEQEKIHLSKELHDSLGPLLSLARMNVSSVESANEKSANKVVEVKDLIAKSIAEVRAISNTLMPSLLSRQGLQAAIEDFSKQINAAGEVTVDLDYHVTTTLSPEQELNIFRIIQEAVTNVLRHAGASRITISFRENESALTLAISDNGKGMDTAGLAQLRGNGVMNMQSRADFLQAPMKMSNLSSGGLTVRFEIPKPNG